MNKTTKIYVIVLLLICSIFIFDKKYFNKELFLNPFINWWNNIEYIRDEYQIRKIVINNVPKLLDQNSSDFDRLNKLREWVNTQTVWSERTVDVKLRNSMNNKTALQMYNYFQTANDNFDCGTFSVFLLKIYQLFGYDGYIYDMGKDGTFRHSVVLVWITDKNVKKLIVQDPSYNLTYVHIDGSPIDFFELLKLIKENNESSVHIKETVGKGHKEICFSNTSCELKGAKVEWKNAAGTIMFRKNYDTRIIKDNLNSFLYCRYLRYYEKIKSNYSLFKHIEIWVIRNKLSSLIEVNWKNNQ